jgi:hypothetical protein
VNKILVGLLLVLWLLAGCLGPGEPSAEEEATSEAERLAYINRLSELIGQAEVFLPAGGEVAAGELSPDGHWLLAGSRQGWVLIDLATGAQRVLEAPESSGGWVTEEYFAIGRHLFHVPDLQVRVLEGHTGKESLSLFQGAESVYVLPGLGFVVLSTDPAYPYWVSLVGGWKGLEALGDIPYTVVLSQNERSLPWQKEALLSPDGRYYALNRSPRDLPTGNANMGVTLFDAATKEIVAMAYKEAWVMELLGWAHDSSGVYIRYYVSNPDGNVLYPEAVTIKLLAPDAPLRGTPVPVATLTTPLPRPLFWPTPIWPTATP